MAYGWVNQKQTYRLEHAEGYLWAPLEDKKGRRNYHWDLLEQVEPGGLIFSYVNAELCKLAVAKTKAVPADRPQGRSFKPWAQKKGRRIEAAYRELPQRIPNAVLRTKMRSLLKAPGRDRPLTRIGGGRQSYFFSLSPGTGRKLLSLADLEGDIREHELATLVHSAAGTETAHETTGESMRRYRIAQEQFSRKVRQEWDGAYAVTGTRVRETIRASHIRPWADCNNRKRLDRHNGLALVATLDALFDAGLISLQDDGKMISRLKTKALKPLGLRGDMRLRHPPSAQMCEYLSYHRQHILRGHPNGRPQPASGRVVVL